MNVLKKLPQVQEELRLSRGICIAMLFSAVLSMFQIALPLYSMQIFDRVLPSDSLPTLVTLSALMAGLTICAVAIDASRSMVLNRIASRLDANLRRQATEIAIHNTNDSQLKDVECIRGFISGPLAPALLDAPWSLAFLVAIFVLNSLLGWFTVTAIILMIGCGVVSHLTTHPLRLITGAKNGEISATLHRVSSARDATAAMGIRRSIINRLSDEQQHARISSLVMGERQAWIDSVSRGLRNLVQVGVMAFAAWLVLSDGLQTGAIVATSMLFARALAPSERLGGSIYTLVNVFAAYKRSRTIVREKTKFVLELPPIRGELSIENVSLLVHGRGRPVLNQISLVVPAGQVVVVVGREGAGKSSLARVLAGVEKPSTGIVRIDGSSISDFSHEALGRQVAFLSDAPHYLQGSVAEIISRGDTPDPALVTRAAIKAGVHHIIQSLPQGYQTELAEPRSLMSTGQLQRLALARAFYGNPRLLVFDEPTMSLDDSGEAAFLNALRELKSEGATIIIVSRWPALLHCADLLIMLDNGSVRLAAGHLEMQQFLAPRLAT